MGIVPGQAPRSTFVTGVAWIFIVPSGFATAMGALQNAVLRYMVPHEELQRAIRQAPPSPNVPPYVSFMVNHFEMMILAFFLIALATLVSSIGLLRRRNWARLIFIAILVIGVIWTFAILAMTAMMYFHLPGPAGTPGAPDMAGIGKLMMGFNGALAIVLGGLSGWIAMRLCSKETRAEFA